MISSASTPVQHLAARLLDRPDEIVAAREPLIASLSERRDLLAAALETVPATNAFLADPFHGGLFALLHLRTGNAERAAQRLLDEHAIGVVPFHDAGRGLEALRITYATLPPERVASVVESATAVVTGGRKVDS